MLNGAGGGIEPESTAWNVKGREIKHAFLNALIAEKVYSSYAFVDFGFVFPYKIEYESKRYGNITVEEINA